MGMLSAAPPATTGSCAPIPLLQFIQRQVRGYDPGAGHPHCLDPHSVLLNCGGDKKCSGSVCATQPTCATPTTSCTSGSQCCSTRCELCNGLCNPALGDRWCVCSQAGEPCHESMWCCDGL